MAEITLSLDYFEHLLNCLANQKYLHELLLQDQQENQDIIDDAWEKGMKMLSHARAESLVHARVED